eukprot:5665401-Prymnesium_polylepis.1
MLKPHSGKCQVGVPLSHELRASGDLISGWIRWVRCSEGAGLGLGSRHGHHVLPYGLGSDTMLKPHS